MSDETTQCRRRDILDTLKNQEKLWRVMENEAQANIMAKAASEIERLRTENVAMQELCEGLKIRRGV